MVVTVDAFQQFRAHPEIAGRLPDVRTLLHRPCRRSVSADVRRDVAVDVGGPHRRREGLSHGNHRFAVPLHHSVPSDAEPLPAAQVGK